MENLAQRLAIHFTKKEKSPDQLWFKELGSFLKKNPNDNEFRGKLSKDNPHGLWNTRPKALTELDNIFQELPHTENVGDHSYHVSMNLNTEESFNGENYLANKPDMLKVVRSVAILHDNGKRKNPHNPKHPYESAQEVEKYLKWMDFNSKEIELCLRLINHHDILGMVIRGHKNISDVIKICHGSPAILQCLWAFTIADVSSIKGLMQDFPNVIKNITEVAKSADHEIRRKSGKVIFYQLK
jgi:hypothetical protein